MATGDFRRALEFCEPLTNLRFKCRMCRNCSNGPAPGEKTFRRSWRRGPRQRPGPGLPPSGPDSRSQKRVTSRLGRKVRGRGKAKSAFSEGGSPVPSWCLWAGPGPPETRARAPVGGSGFSPRSVSTFRAVFPVGPRACRAKAGFFCFLLFIFILYCF